MHQESYWLVASQPPNCLYGRRTTTASFQKKFSHCVTVFLLRRPSILLEDFLIFNLLERAVGYLDRKSSHTFTVCGDATHVARVVPRVVLPIVLTSRGTARAPRAIFIATPLREKRMVAEGAHECWTIFSQLLHVGGWRVFKQRREEGRVTPLKTDNTNLINIIKYV